MEFNPALLLDDVGATAALSIDQEALDWLVSTQQLLPIYIRGRRLFRYSDLQELVAGYQVVQHRNEGVHAN